MKKGGIYLIVGSLLVCGLLNVILFLTLPDGRTDSTVFWMVWAFAFPLCFVAFMGAVLFKNKRIAKQMSDLPIIQNTIFCAFGAYLVIMIIFGYFNINDIVLPLILDLIVTVLAAVIIIYAKFAHESDKYVKEKILTLNLLKADLEGCYPAVTDQNVLKAMKAFADDIRFSDPMSHPSLAGIESELSVTVSNICSLVAEGKFEQVIELLNKGKMQLQQRNSRCKILK